jgi:hypothetical protein
MISSRPFLVANEKVNLYDKVAAYIAHARKQAEGGLTVSELAELIVAAMRLAIAAVDQLDLAGEQKKEIVADLAVTLFDEFADLVVPVALLPGWWLVKPALRTLIRTAAAGAVDALLPLVRKADE